MCPTELANCFQQSYGFNNPVTVIFITTVWNCTMTYKQACLIKKIQLHFDSKSIKVHCMVTKFNRNFILTEQTLRKLLIKSSFLCQLQHLQTSIDSNKLTEPHFLQLSSNKWDWEKNITLCFTRFIMLLCAYQNSNKATLTCAETRPVPQATSRTVAFSLSPLKNEFTHSAANKGAR